MPSDKEKVLQLQAELIVKEQELSWAIQEKTDMELVVEEKTKLLKLLAAQLQENEQKHTDAVQKQLENFEQEKRQLEQTAAEQAQELVRVQQEQGAAAKQEDVDGLKQQLHKANQCLADKHTALTTVQARVSELEEQARTNTQPTVDASALTRLELTCTAFETELAAVKELLATEKKEVRSAKLKLEAKEKTVARLQGDSVKLKSAERALAKLEQELEEARAEGLNHAQAVSNLKKDMAEAEAQWTKKCSSLGNTEMQLQKAEEQISLLKEQLNQTETRLTHTEARARLDTADLQGTVEELQAKIVWLDEEIARLHVRNDELSSVQSVDTDTHISVAEHRRIVEKMQASAVTETNVMTERHQAEIDTAKDTLHGLTEQVRVLLEEKAQWGNAQSVLERVKKSALRDKERLEKAHESLEDHRVRLRAAMQTINEQTVAYSTLTDSFGVEQEAKRVLEAEVQSLRETVGVLEGTQEKFDIQTENYKLLYETWGVDKKEHEETRQELEKLKAMVRSITTGHEKPPPQAGTGHHHTHHHPVTAPPSPRRLSLSQALVSGGQIAADASEKKQSALLFVELNDCKESLRKLTVAYNNTCDQLALSEQARKVLATERDVLVQQKENLTELKLAAVNNTREKEREYETLHQAWTDAVQKHDEYKTKNDEALNNRSLQVIQLKEKLQHIMGLYEESLEKCQRLESDKHSLVADAENAMAKAKEMEKELFSPAPVAKKTISGSPPPVLSEADQERELKHKLEQTQAKTLATLKLLNRGITKGIGRKTPSETAERILHECREMKRHTLRRQSQMHIQLPSKHLSTDRIDLLQKAVRTESREYKRLLSLVQTFELPAENQTERQRRKTYSFGQ